MISNTKIQVPRSTCKHLAPQFCCEHTGRVSHPGLRDDNLRICRLGCRSWWWGNNCIAQLVQRIIECIFGLRKIWEYKKDLKPSRLERQSLVTKTSAPFLSITWDEIQVFDAPNITGQQSHAKQWKYGKWTSHKANIYNICTLTHLSLYLGHIWPQYHLHVFELLGDLGFWN